MNSLDELIAIEEIKKLKGRYQRALDAGKWDEFANCLAEDFTVWETGLSEPVVGREAVLKQTRQSFKNYGGWKHHVLLPDIEILSDTTAKGVWTITSFEGIYEDEYVKIDGKWRVRKTSVTLSEKFYNSLMERRANMARS
jgi:SnoaL-like domain